MAMEEVPMDSPLGQVDGGNVKACIYTNRFQQKPLMVTPILRITAPHVPCAVSMLGRGP